MADTVEEKKKPRKKLTDYGKIKIGTKTLNDAVIDHLGSYQDIWRSSYYQPDIKYYDKSTVLRAIAERDYHAIRMISEFFYRTNGIYQRLINYYATMYRWDWYIAPTVFDEDVYDNEKQLKKVTNEFFKSLNYLDNTHIKKVCADISLKILKYGVWYGYVIQGDDGIILQELPIEYCRSRYSVNNLPVVEMNMAFFDEHFHDINYRMRVIKMMPKDIQKGYVLYKERKLRPDFSGDESYWYALEPGAAVKFFLSSAGEEMPLFINVIPYLLDLDTVQDLDRRKQLQQLLKIVVQHIPRTKDDELIFDLDEASVLQDNALFMLRHAVGTDVLTTPLDVDSIDLSDANNIDDDTLKRAERTVYNAAGVSEGLFNSSTNLSINNSILQDEGVMRDLKLQFEVLFDRIIQERNTNRKKYAFRFFILDTTQYNYKELSKTYKDQMTVGFGKLLAQIALGHSQNSIISTAYFENDILDLKEVMIPPMASTSISSEDVEALDKNRKSKKGTSQTSTEGESTGGRPKKDETEVSDKTIQNRNAEK